jgi:alanine racemase
VVRPTFARIDLDALTSNYRVLREFVKRGAPDAPPEIIAVVKANAYGHGLVSTARALEAAGATMLACADIEEGVQLRQGGVGVPILVFGALSVSDLSGVFDFDLTPTVSSPSAATALQSAAASREVRLRCHLKIDTGMNRFGFRHDNLSRTIPDVLACENLVFDAVYTHFATADEPEGPLFEAQRARFSTALETLASLGLGPVATHAANSSALLRDRAVWHQAVRPGLLLYGVVPLRLDVPTGLVLRPVMSLRSRVVAVKGLRAGETAGYGARFTALRATRVAIVPAGYGDGLDVRLAGTGHVLVRGRPAAIIGSVCMDSITIDVTDLDVAPGDEVAVIGEQGNARVDAADVARWTGTKPHEVLCRTGIRIERVYTAESPV